MMEIPDLWGDVEASQPPPALVLREQIRQLEKRTNHRLQGTVRSVDLGDKIRHTLTICATFLLEEFDLVCVECALSVPYPCWVTAGFEEEWSGARAVNYDELLEHLKCVLSAPSITHRLNALLARTRTKEIAT
jgi:hypothetical protein